MLAGNPNRVRNARFSNPFRDQEGGARHVLRFAEDEGVEEGETERGQKKKKRY